MSLRAQLGCLLAVLASAIVALTYSVQLLVVLPAFEQIERREAVRDLDRFIDAMGREEQLLAHLTHDWNAWDDLYDFVQNSNDKFREANLNDEAFQHANVNLIYILNVDKQVVWGTLWDLDANQRMGAPNLDAYLKTISDSIFAFKSKEDVKSGILPTEHGPLLFSTRPIVTSEGLGPVEGAIMFGRLIQAEELAGIADRTHLDIDSWTIESNQLPAGVEPALTHLPSNHEKILVSDKSDKLRAYAVIDDFFGKPVLMIRANIARDVTMQGRVSAYTATLCCLIAAMLTIVILWVVLQNRVVIPLTRMALHAELVGSNGDLSSRLDDNRQDEIGVLSRSLDSMVFNLEQSRKKVLDEACKAEAANRSKTEFLANMSHEIRTPMSAILGYTDILMEESEKQDSSRRNDAISTIRRNGTHLLEIIDDILDLSKIEAGKLETQVEPCNIFGLVSEVLALMQVRADQKQIQLSARYETPIPEIVNTDAIRVKQVLINLVGNAIKFTDQGYVQIRIRIRLQDAQSALLELDVVDTGVGISTEQSTNLFRPFEQVDASSKRRYGGTGLGLTISKRLANMLGGDVTLVSSCLGVGSNFQFSFHVEIAEGVGMKLPDHSETKERGLDRIADCKTMSASVIPAGPLHPQPLNQCRVLLVEDGVDNQRLIKHFLTKAGAEVTLVDNGKLAVDAALDSLLSDRCFDVILMDMQMPVMDGYEATSILRRCHYEGPIIALTAHAMSGDRDVCVKSGCNDYATKPIDRLKLIDLIAKYNNQGRLEESNGNTVIATLPLSDASNAFPSIQNV